MMVGSQKSTFKIGKKIIYLAGPLTDEDETIQLNNIRFACDVAAELRGAGMIVISPHEMGYHHPDSLDYEAWMDHGLQILSRCDEVMLLPGWEYSAGTQREISFAGAYGIPATKYLDWVKDYGGHDDLV